jgi:hypothetical protein
MGRFKILYRAEKGEKTGRIIRKALEYSNLTGKKVEIEFCPPGDFATSPNPIAKLVICPQWDMNRAMRAYKDRIKSLGR